MREDETRKTLIDKMLENSGWIIDENVKEEYVISPGMIINERGNRIRKKRADYVLFYPTIYDGHPIAVVEAKRVSKDVLAGLEQAKAYMKMLGVPFAYATNGHEIVEYNIFTKRAVKINKFPTPSELWERKVRWEEIEDPNPLKVPYKIVEGKTLRYYQYVAVENAIKAILSGKKRVLLTMATGSGKTYVAFQIAWKLYRANRVRRILYLVDRIFLREQAYNAFEPFGNARIELTSDNITMAKDIYFATYQTLYSKKDSKRVYEHFDRDFFDMVIIDECHRSGWKRWHDILRYFKNAIHLGLTATPKRTDNIDTYAYFGKPVYEYPMARGIEDGFLAPPYEIIRVWTNIDKEGKLVIRELKSKGIKIEVPEGAELKEYYTMEEFEKEILLPDRTRKIVEWIAKFLEETDPLAKTVIFCPTQRHAREVATLLNNYFNPKFEVDNYAYPIIAEDREAHDILRRKFANSDEKFPVVATTVDVLSTGVDVPPIKNVIFLKPINSKVEFHQIIGRATRIDERSGKYVFRIIDFTGAARLFDEWDVPSLEPPKEGKRDWFLKIQILDGDTLEPIKNADVVVFVSPSNPLHVKSDDEGFIFVEGVPREAVKVDIRASGYKGKETIVPTFPTSNPREYVTVTLRPTQRKTTLPVKVEGLDVYIDEENRVKIDVRGNKLLDAEYIKYSKDEIKKRVTRLEDLKEIWKNKNKREAFKNELKRLGIDLKLLAKVKKMADVDEFDLLANILFDAPVISRDERARMCLRVKREFINKHGEKIRELIFDLIDRYRMFGIDELRPEVLEHPYFRREYGGLMEVIKILGDGDPNKGMRKLIMILEELIRGIYADLYEEV
ncbi:hypothetical protein A3L04_05360 [Thermococcus chitonophagus]|uniref:Type I restriction-modification system, restriction subunit R n=1 Tax=Thermococcus chitonophagus TaxID=54262 RepID=A0A160VV12_9EURY|nr:DEAD/DEAH box helicase family protein [Thermococcus chitonophagus]ASJ16541.1 hypothetical protein A3L04_05360 [Thermococcus chitonophagus]CUX77551.1 Type I restriction-modification system, restriction subunit R [Thermococcus chitonophagus]